MPRPAISPRAITLVAERLIEQAIARGELDGLPGEGKPLPDRDEPYEPSWWIKSWLKRNAPPPRMTAPD